MLMESDLSMNQMKTYTDNEVWIKSKFLSSSLLIDFNWFVKTMTTPAKFTEDATSGY